MLKDHVGLLELSADRPVEVLTPERAARPKGWDKTADGEPMPDSVALVREVRDGD